MRLLVAISFFFLQLFEVSVGGFANLPSCCGRHAASTSVSAETIAVATPLWLVAEPQEQLPQVEKVSSIEEASRVLQEWDRYYNPDVADDADQNFDAKTARTQLPLAVLLLNKRAAVERQKDSTRGRCMLGICASSTEEAVATLKAWVTALQLPRGLLHGMDKDGVPIEIEGGVYIKYNTGGSTTFSSIRKTGMGFDALWKPGDALVEPYDGTYRGVYFQVELADGEFRQYLLPLDTFSLA